MKELNNYIIEKLHIDKNTKINAGNFPINVEIWSTINNIYTVRDMIKEYTTDIIRFGVKGLQKENDAGYKLYSIMEIETLEALLDLCVFIIEYEYGEYEDNLKEFKRLLKENLINNYDDIEEDINLITQSLLKNANKKLLDILNKKTGI